MREEGTDAERMDGNRMDFGNDGGQGMEEMEVHQ